MPASIIVNLATHTFIYVSFNSGREDGIIYYLCLTESICNSDVKTKKKIYAGTIYSLCIQRTTFPHCDMQGLLSFFDVTHVSQLQMMGCVDFVSVTAIKTGNINCCDRGNASATYISTRDV